MTQSDFIKQYCNRSHLEEQNLNKLGIFSVACDCGEESCHGWAMTSRENIKSHIELYLQDSTKGVTV